MATNNRIQLAQANPSSAQRSGTSNVANRRRTPKSVLNAANEAFAAACADGERRGWALLNEIKTQPGLVGSGLLVGKAIRETIEMDSGYTVGLASVLEAALGS